MPGSCVERPTLPICRTGVVKACGDRIHDACELTVNSSLPRAGKGRLRPGGEPKVVLASDHGRTRRLNRENNVAIRSVAPVPRNFASAPRVQPGRHGSLARNAKSARRDPVRPIRTQCRRGGGYALGRSRTFNLRIKSPLLCQLSYECD